MAQPLFYPLAGFFPVPATENVKSARPAARGASVALPAAGPDSPARRSARLGEGGAPFSFTRGPVYVMIHLYVRIFTARPEIWQNS